MFFFFIILKGERKRDGKKVSIREVGSEPLTTSNVVFSYSVTLWRSVSKPSITSSNVFSSPLPDLG